MAKKAKKSDYTHCKVNQTANARAPWRVWYAAEREGKSTRVFKSFASEGAARAFADEKEIEISNHGVRYGDIPPEVRRAYDYYRDQSVELSAIGAEIPRFEELVAKSLAEIRNLHNLKIENQMRLCSVLRCR